MSEFSLDDQSQITLDGVKFEAQRELGRGGNAAVYEVHGHGRRFALKIPLADRSDPVQIGDYNSATASLLAEAEIKPARGLVTGTFATVEDEHGRVVAGLLMPKADTSLANELDRSPNRLKRGPYFDDDNRIAAIMQHVACGLQTLHQRDKLVHRDIKPENILLFKVGQNERAAVGDFGSARPIGSPNMLGGTTLGYSRPENEATDKRPSFSHANSPKDDVYALGATLFVLETQRPISVQGDQAVVAMPWGNMRTTVETAVHDQDLQAVRIQLCSFSGGAKAVEPERRAELLNAYLAKPQKNPMMDAAIAHEMRAENFADKLPVAERSIANQALEKREHDAGTRLAALRKQPEPSQAQRMVR